MTTATKTDWNQIDDLDRRIHEIECDMRDREMSQPEYQSLAREKARLLALVRPLVDAAVINDPYPGYKA